MPITALPTPQVSGGLPDAQASGVLPRAQVQFTVGADTSLDASIAGFGQTYLGAIMEQRRQQLLAQSGMDPNGDPNAMTLPEAKSQTDTALAKIAAVNPGLAQELQHRRDTGDSGGHGLLGSLWHDITSGFGKALDLLSRPARVIPSIIVEGHKGTDAMTAAWHALSGQDKSSWSSALDGMGIHNSWMKGVLGFGLDVALDPLTYATFGAGGVGREVVAKTAARATFRSIVDQGTAERALGGIARGGVKAGETADSMDTLFNHLTQAGMSPDAAAGTAALGVIGADRDLLLKGYHAADQVMRQVQTVGFRNMPGVLPITDGTGNVLTTVTKDQVFRQLEHLRTFRGATATRGAYQESKAAAGAVGGVRFQFPILRWVSPVIPGTEGFGLQPLRRFFVGQSALVRIAKSIDAGDGVATLDDFNRWVSAGAQKAVESNPNLMHLWGGSGTFGSMLWRTSDRVGRLTAGFSNHALAYRVGGLTGAMAHDLAVNYKTWRRRFMDEVALTWHGADGQKMDPTTVTEEFERVLEKGGKATAADYARHRNFLELVPGRDAAANLDSWWSTNVMQPLSEAHVAGQLSDTEYEAKVAAAQQHLKDASTSLQDVKQNGELDALLRYRELQDSIRDYGVRWGAPVRDTSVDAEGAVMVRPEQMGKWNGGTPFAGETYHLTPYEGDELYRWLAEGVSQSDHHAGVKLGLGEGTGAGVHLTKEGDGLTVGIRLRNPMRGLGQWEDLRKEVQPVVDEMQATKSGLIDSLDPENGAIHLDEMLTQAAQARGHDGLVWTDANNTERALVFDHKNVKLMHDQAPNLVWDRGYFPREFSRELRDVIGRKHSPDEFTAVVSELRHSMQRKMGHLSFDEASGVVRKELRVAGYDVADTTPIFETAPMRVHQDYAQAFADAVLGEAGGRVLRRIKDFGAAVPGTMGGAVGDTLWRYPEFVPQKVLDELAKTDQQAAESYVGARKLLESAERKRTRAAVSIHENMTKLRQLLDEKDPMFLDYSKGPRVGTPKGGTTDLRQALVDASKQSSILKGELANAGKNGARGADEVKADIAALREHIKGLKSDARQGEGGVNRGRTAAAVLTESEHQVRAAEDELRRAQAALNQHALLKAQHRTDVSNLEPALVPFKPDKSGFVSVKLPGQHETFWAHPYIADEMNSLVRRMGGPNEFRKFWRSQVMARWKTWATVMNIGFHARNNLGAMFNNLLGGVDMTDYDHAWRVMRVALQGDGYKWTDRVIDPAVVSRYHLGMHFPKGQDITYRDLFHLIDDDQVTSASSRAFADRLPHPLTGGTLEGELRVRGVNLHRRGPVGKVVDAAQKHVAEPMTAHTENLHRFAMYLGGMRQGAGDRGLARLTTMMRQGDYVDLNDWESGLVRDVLPFYKWLRTNLPYQVHQLFEHPGAHLTWLKAKNMLWNVQGLDFEKWKAKMPAWMRDEFIIPLPLGGKGTDALHAMTLDLPMADLYNGLNEYVSMFLPVVRPFVESAVTHKVTFTGADLTGKMEPLPDWMHPFGWMLEHLGVAKPTTDGGYAISDRMANLFTTLPIYSRYRNWLTADPTRVKNRAATLASVFFGAGLRNIDEQAMTNAELEFYSREIAPLVAQLRSLGVQFPDKRALSPETFTALGLTPPPATTSPATQAA